MQIGNTDVTVNEDVIKNDVAPVIRNDRTLVPIRIAAETLGGKVDWNDATKEVTLNIDGKEIQSCGDTCIFEQDGLEPDVDFEQTDIYSQSTGKIDENTYIAGIVNQYKNYFGKSRVVVIKSQLGQPITAYSGDEVYWKIPKKLPKMTKLMIDGKALYIHRANFQIIDTALLN